jgi:hypothetical protein
MDMLCFMHESSNRGFLLIGSTPVTADKLARMVGESLETTQVLLHELREAGVFSETDNGAIYSRRLVRDEQKSETNTKNGLNGGNPALRTSLVSGVQTTLLEPESVARLDPISGRKDDSDNRVSTGAVKGGLNRAFEEEEEEEAEGVLGEGLRGGGIDEHGEPTWRTRQPKRVPEDFYPTKSMRHKAHLKGADDNAFLDWQTEKFMNYFVNATGKNASKTDWARAWQNWIMRAIEDGEFERWKRRTARSGAARTPTGDTAGGRTDPYSAEAIAARKKRGRGDGGDGGKDS